MLSLRRFASLSADHSSFIAACRGAAALIVLLAHLQQVFLAPFWTGSYAYWLLVAQFSVMVFFVLSGFLIGKSITKKTASGQFSLVAYGADRAWRILPPLALAFVVMLGLAPLAPHTFPSGTPAFLPTSGYVVVREFTVQAREFLTAALFLNGFFGSSPLINGPLWSLSFEVWLYVIAALVVAGRTSRLSLAGVAILFVVLSVRNHNFAAYGIVWASGFVLCLLHNNQRLGGWIRTALTGLAPVALACALLLAWQYVAQVARFPDPRSADYRYVIAFNVFIGLAFCGLLGLLLDRRAPTLRWLTGSADYSYTLYIVHYPILLFTFGAFQPAMQASMGTLAAISLVTLAGIVLFARTAARVVEHRPTLLRLFGVATQARA